MALCHFTKNRNAYIQPLDDLIIVDGALWVHTFAFDEYHLLMLPDGQNINFCTTPEDILHLAVHLRIAAWKGCFGDINPAIQ